MTVKEDRNSLARPSPQIQARLDAHRLWVESGGVKGKRLVTEEGESANWKKLDLSGVDLRNADIRGMDYHGSSLRSADFRGATLTAIGFNRCDLTGALFDGADVALCSFIDARMDPHQLSKAKTRLLVWTKAEASEVARIMREP